MVMFCIMFNCQYGNVVGYCISNLVRFYVSITQWISNPTLILSSLFCYWYLMFSLCKFYMLNYREFVFVILVKVGI